MVKIAAKGEQTKVSANPDAPLQKFDKRTIRQVENGGVGVGGMAVVVVGVAVVVV